MMFSIGSSGYQRGGGTWKFRIAIAAVIALISVISYFSKSDVNQMTGEAQKVSLSPAQEMALGEKAVPEMLQQFGGEARTQAGQDRIDQIGNRLLEALNKELAKQDKQNPYRYEFYLLADEKTINAFALPGGQVFITKALYDRLETDGQLAAVLGHEIGHVIERHGAQRMAKMELTQGLTGAAAVASGDADTARTAQVIGQMINMSYGRGDELESDGWGVELCALAGYDPRAMFGVMKVLEEASGGGGQPEFLSTHPKPANRVEYVKQILAEKFPDGIPENLEP